jgi:ferrochelatase
LRFVTQYHDDPAYIDALCESIRAHRATHGAADRLLFSFHGLPKRYLLQGDPYFCQCHKTARLVAERLELADERWQVVFQSRFGREEWLKPYADHTLARLPKEGVKSVEVVCPGFSADCLETLEEMAEQNRDVFIDAGGESYHYIPALNDLPTHIATLADLIAAHCQGWPETSPAWNSDEVHAAANRSRERALAHGASR